MTSKAEATLGSSARRCGRAWASANGAWAVRKTRARTAAANFLMSPSLSCTVFASDDSRTMEVIVSGGRFLCQFKRCSATESVGRRRMAERKSPRVDMTGGRV